MQRNKKLTIALTFLLTFLIGIGAGYLLRGGLQPSIAERERTDLENIERGLRSGDRDVRIDQEREEGIWRRQRRPAEPVERTDQRFDRSTVDDNDTFAEQSRYRDEDPRHWQNGERPDFRRLRYRLQRDLNLSDEKAEEFFHILEQHREQIREEMSEHNIAIRERYRKLAQQLEDDLSEVLTDDQMETWYEEYSPRMERFGRGRPGERQP